MWYDQVGFTSEPMSSLIGGHINIIMAINDKSCKAGVSKLAAVVLLSLLIRLLELSFLHMKFHL